MITREGEELLAYSRMLLEQADIMQEHFGKDKNRTPKFSVSCQHYSFCGQCVCGFGETVRCQPVQFILRETQTGEIIDDVAQGKSEVGILYLSAHNEEVLTKLMKKNGLVFEELFVAEPHVFICREHPLANKKRNYTG